MTLDTALKVKNFSADALELLKKYHWPGNVRSCATWLNGS